MTNITPSNNYYLLLVIVTGHYFTKNKKVYTSPITCYNFSELIYILEGSFMMVEFFANQVVNYLKHSIEEAGQHIQPDTLFISPDSENAICCKLCDGGVSYWVLSANPDTNKYHVHQVVIDRNNDCVCDDVFIYTTIKEVLEYIHSVAVQNAKWIQLNSKS